MKKLVLTLALIGVAASLSYGQGTVAFANGALTRATLVTPTTTVNVPTTAGLINYGLFWGTTADNLTLVPALGVNSTATDGVIAGAASLTFPIPGSTEGQSVFLQVKGWSATFGNDWLAASTQGTWFGQSRIVQTTLAPTAGPGVTLWQTASGVNATRIYPLQLNAVAVVPEPTSFALAGLGAAALLIFRRRN